MEVGQEMRNSTWGSFPVQSLAQLDFSRLQSFPRSGNKVKVSSWASGLLFSGKFPGYYSYLPESS